MSKSEVCKKRIKLLRQSGKEVAENRGTTAFSTHVRLTKSKKETLDNEFRKHKKHCEID